MNDTTLTAMARRAPGILLFMLVFATIGTFNAFSRETRAVYDGRLSLEAARPSRSEEALLKKKVFPAARKAWHQQGRDEPCEAGGVPEVIDIASGSFTRAKSGQRAVLYRYCMTGHNMALNGIAVLENERLAAHVIYEGGWDNAVGAMPDLNGSGLSEILIATGGTNMGETWGSIAIIELSETGVIRFGRTNTYSDNGGAVVDRHMAEARRISVKSGNPPVFYRETFTRKADDGRGSDWRKTGALKRLSLEKDETEYRLLK